MHAFYWKCEHFTGNVSILCKLDENARIFMKMHKTKFSEIGLTSSKGISSKDPMKPTGTRIRNHHLSICMPALNIQCATVCSMKEGSLVISSVTPRLSVLFMVKFDIKFLRKEMMHYFLLQSLKNVVIENFENGGANIRHSHFSGKNAVGGVTAKMYIKIILPRYSLATICLLIPWDHVK